MATIINKYKAMVELVLNSKTELRKNEALKNTGSSDIVVGYIEYEIQNNTVKLPGATQLDSNVMDYYCTHKFVVATNKRLILANRKYMKEEDVYKELYEFLELYLTDIKEAVGKQFFIAESFSPDNPDYVKAKFIIDAYKRSIMVDMKQYEKTCKTYDKISKILELANQFKNEMETSIIQKKTLFSKPIHEIVECVKKDMDAINGMQDVEDCEFTDKGARFKVWPIVLSEMIDSTPKYACIGGIQFVLDISKANVSLAGYDKNDTSSKTNRVDKNLWHPHVSGDRFCMGDSGGREFKALCNKGELLPVIKFLVQRIKHYNSNSPFFRMRDTYKYFPTIKEAIINERVKK